MMIALRFDPVREPISLSDLKPQIVLAVLAAMPIWQTHKAHEIVITSVNDHSHSRTSLHYAGQAVDIRRWDLDSAAEARRELAIALNGPTGKGDFDVILESDHIHIEYQPKRRD